MKPYYDHGGITIYHGDCRDIIPHIWASVLVTDPPYGIGYSSNKTGYHGGVSLPGIIGDEDTSLRDYVLAWWGGRSALVFGSWKRPRPAGCKAVLVWDKGDHVGMGDLAIPWKPNTEEIYVLGSGFNGRRSGSVLRYNAPVTWNTRGRTHPHEKPIGLMNALVQKCPAGLVLDPFMGSGSALEAARNCGRSAIGIEIEEHFCEIAAERLAQEVLPLEYAVNA